MNIRISDIFREKLNNIQSRTPIKINENSNEISFQEILNSKVNGNTSLSGNNTKGNVELMPAIEKAVNDASKKYGIPSNIVSAVIAAESNFNPTALSSKGAQGLMQLMPGTAKSLGVNNPWDITQNIEGGVKYLKEQLDQFGGDLKLALAAYNAGPNSVTKHNGVPPYAETQDYVKKILGSIDEYK
ncbi:lytic transglycosylase domain-containing protein [Petroclostridium sp. X23]|uniref:lytic transglycosylase domain-containing protein n=1 Tax=Petroclostridium sp. X23 TaxID=3045146 RepID=UPI0024AD39F4|nr:lytic transglycosylase domain-containing protein [Petroclostridium sp. X23]WHH58431.1 lytic transglycosylase domain-containing protein [Petroclostridium sp. X23]